LPQPAVDSSEGAAKAQKSCVLTRTLAVLPGTNPPKFA
jgi:hypothetical protein